MQAFTFTTQSGFEIDITIDNLTEDGSDEWTVTVTRAEKSAMFSGENLAEVVCEAFAKARVRLW